MKKELASPGYRNSKKGIRGQEKTETSSSGGERNRKFKAKDDMLYRTWQRKKEREKRE